MIIQKPENHLTVIAQVEARMGDRLLGREEKSHYHQFKVRGKDAKAFRAMDLVAVVDIDDDGRNELIVQYRYAKVRTWGVYSPDPGLTKLTLVGEVEPWSAEQ